MEYDVMVSIVDGLVFSKKFSDCQLTHLRGHIHRSIALSGIYASKATTPPVIIPISPVPARAMGPVYHVCCMLGTMIPNPHKNASTAAMPGGSPVNLFHCVTSYAAQRLRYRKCSVRMMTAKMVDQYPITPDRQ